MREAIAVKEQEPDADQTLKNLLLDWADWMRHDPRIGFNSRVPILATGMGSSTFEELLEQVDSTAMRAVDGSIESLPPANKSAIYRHTGICAVFRFPRANYPYEVALSDAFGMLVLSLRRKGILS
jgi:hypothetical protein